MTRSDNLDVVRAWLDRRPGRNYRDTLHTNGADLYSYRLRIGYTLPDGKKVVVLHKAPNNFVSVTTSRHVVLAVDEGVRSLGSDGILLENPLTGELRPYYYDAYFNGAEERTLQWMPRRHPRGKKTVARDLKMCRESGIPVGAHYIRGFALRGISVPQHLYSPVRKVLAADFLAARKKKELLRGLAAGDLKAVTTVEALGTFDVLAKK